MSLAVTRLLATAAVLVNLWNSAHSSPWVFIQDPNADDDRRLEIVAKRAAATSPNSSISEEDYCGHTVPDNATVCNIVPYASEWVKCPIDDEGQQHVTIRRGYWVGYYGDDLDTIAVGRCPFCGSTYAPQLGDFVSISLQDQCVPNRTGVLCSQCCNGTWPSLNLYHYRNLDCSDCENESPFLKFFSLHLAFNTLLFGFIFVFDFTLTSGALSSSIFLAQMLSTILKPNGDGVILFLPGQNATDTNGNYAAAYDFFDEAIDNVYGIWILNFIAAYQQEFCLDRSIADNLDAIAIDYVVAVMPLLPFTAFVTIQFVYNRCSKLRRRFDDNTCTCTCFGLSPGKIFKQSVYIRFDYSKSLTTIFSAGLLLSYAKFTITTFYILKKSELNVFNLTNGKYYVSSVFYFDGSKLLDAQGFRNAPVWMATIVLIVIVIGLPLVLLFLKYEKRPEHDISRRSSALKKLAKKSSLFIDFFILRPFQRDLRWGNRNEPPETLFFKFSCGPRDRRWMAGWYFLLRLAFYATYAALNTFRERVLAQEIISIVALLVTAIIRPYRRRLHNWIECVNFASLIVINAMTIYQYTLITSGEELSLSAFYIQVTLAGVPFCFIALYLPVKLVRNWMKINEEQEYMFLDEKELEDEEESIHEPTMVTKCLGFLESVLKKSVGRRAQQPEIEPAVRFEAGQQDEEECQTSPQRSSSVIIDYSANNKRSHARRGISLTSSLMRRLNLRSRDELTCSTYKLMDDNN